MATEQGIVIKVDKTDTDLAVVKTVQSSACESCSSRHHCNPGTSGKDREVEAINLVNACEGDLIQISMDTGPLMATIFLLYVFPIICLLAGAFAGSAMGEKLGMNSSASSALAGITCFAAAMLIVRKRAGGMALKRKYKPKITRILGRGTAAGGNPAPTTPDACEGHITGNI